jgi:hypothetical protein
MMTKKGQIIDATNLSGIAQCACLMTMPLQYEGGYVSIGDMLKVWSSAQFIQVTENQVLDLFHQATAGQYGRQLKASIGSN